MSAISLVNNSASAATGSAGSVAPAIGSTTAGNLLICKISMPGYTSAPTFTFPANWVQAGSTAVHASGACTQVWYLKNCAAAITSVSITYSGGATVTGFALYAWLEQYASANKTSPLDVTGTVTGTATPENIATSSTTTAIDELAVTVSAGYYSSATKDTLAAGTGFTLAGSVGNGTKQQTHASFDYELTSKSSSGITVTDAVTFTGPFTAYAGSIATFLPVTAPSETLNQSFEGGTSGNTIATSDTQSAGDTAFTSVTGTPAYDNTRAAHGLLSAKVTVSASTGFVTWQPGIANPVWFRGYFYFTANPTVSTMGIVHFQDAGSGLTSFIAVTTAGVLQVAALGTATISLTTALPLNAWFRLEGKLSWDGATTTTFELKIFTAMDSTTADETKSSSGTAGNDWSLLGAFGPYSSSTCTFWMDDLGWSDIGYIGPAVATAFLARRPLVTSQALNAGASF